MERISSDPNTVRAMLLLLEQRGLVVRERHPTDGRARTVALTGERPAHHEEAMGTKRALPATLIDCLQ